MSRRSTAKPLPLLCPPDRKRIPYSLECFVAMCCFSLRRIITYPAMTQARPRRKTVWFSLTIPYPTPARPITHTPIMNILSRISIPCRNVVWLQPFPMKAPDFLLYFSTGCIVAILQVPSFRPLPGCLRKKVRIDKAPHEIWSTNESMCCIHLRVVFILPLKMHRVIKGRRSPFLPLLPAGKSRGPRLSVDPTSFMV